MASREETAQVLSRHTEELFRVWHQSPQELSALLTYIACVSDKEQWKKEINKRETASLLLVFGGRIPEQGISELLNIFTSHQENNVACLIAESSVSATLNPLPFTAQEFAEHLKIRGWKGNISLNEQAQNTGDQAEALIKHLSTSPQPPKTIVIAASIDHVGRMLATIMDALEVHDFITKDISLIPLALGAWEDFHKENFTCEDLAFGSEGLQKGSASSQQGSTDLYARLAGQYTFRWQRALEAKAKGEFKGRTIVTPSHALELLNWGRGV